MLGFFESAEVKAAKGQTVKELQATIKRLEQGAKSRAEVQEDRDRATTRSHEREILELELSHDDHITELTRDQDKRCGELGSKILVLERAAKEKSEDRQLAIARAVQSYKDHEAAKVEAASVRLERSAGMIKEVQAAYAAEAEVSDNLKVQVNNYRNIIDVLLLKIPDVKLDKFNINVEVPAAKVETTIVK